MLTSAEEFWPPSLMLDAAICECSSITPEVKCFPVALTISAFPVDKLIPIFSILPFLTKTSVSFKIPPSSLVQTVAFLKRMVCCFGTSEKPYPTFG